MTPPSAEGPQQAGGARQRHRGHGGGPPDVLRASLVWLLAWLLSAAFYLLLIDITDLPELIVGAVVASLAASGFLLARSPDPAGRRFRAGWLARIHRPLLQVPGDVVRVSRVALAQLLRPQRVRGTFRAVPFSAHDGAGETGRHALAEALGSFAPNTIVVGVDGERGLILAHQLRRSGGREAIDLMELG